jgi:hypothetical protein
VITLLLEYFSESKKLSRGSYTDTFNPLILSEIITWPSSVFVATWKGYPDQFDQAVSRELLNESLSSHFCAIAVQAILVFGIVLVGNSRPAAGGSGVPGDSGRLQKPSARPEQQRRIASTAGRPSGWAAVPAVTPARLVRCGAGLAGMPRDGAR